MKNVLCQSHRAIPSSRLLRRRSRPRKRMSKMPRRKGMARWSRLLRRGRRNDPRQSGERVRIRMREAWAKPKKEMARMPKTRTARMGTAQTKTKGKRTTAMPTATICRKNPSTTSSMSTNPLHLRLDLLRPLPPARQKTLSPTLSLPRNPGLPAALPEPQPRLPPPTRRSADLNADPALPSNLSRLLRRND